MQEALVMELEARDPSSGLAGSTASWSLATADYECRHGRLGGDPTPACGCWPAEVGARTPDLLTALRDFRD